MHAKPPTARVLKFRSPRRLGDRCRYVAWMRFSILNLILVIAVVGLALMLIIERNTDRSLTLRSHERDSLLTWETNEELLYRAPAWTDKSQNPPLRVGDALKISDEIIGNLERVTTYQNWKVSWEVSSIGIVPLGPWANSTTTHWCYVIYFRGFGPINSGPGLPFSAMVLMDGTVLITENILGDEFEYFEAMKKNIPSLTQFQFPCSRY